MTTATRVRSRGVQHFYRKTRTSAGFHGAAVDQHPGDFKRQLRMIREVGRVFIYPDDPEEVAVKYSKMTPEELLQIALNPCPYRPGTWERVMTYRLRETINSGLRGYSIFNSMDSRDSTLGTPIERNPENLSLGDLFGVEEDFEDEESVL